MRVGVPKETAAGEQRVALVPDAVARLEGFTVVVERGAGVAAGFPDAAYAEAGAELVDDAWDGVDGGRQGRAARPTRSSSSSSAGQLLSRSCSR